MKKYLAVLWLFASLSFAGPTPQTIIECDDFWLPKIAEAKAAYERASQRYEQRKSDPNSNDLFNVVVKMSNLCFALNNALDYCFQHDLTLSKTKYCRLIG